MPRTRIRSTRLSSRCDRLPLRPTCSSCSSTMWASAPPRRSADRATRRPPSGWRQLLRDRVLHHRGLVPHSVRRPSGADGVQVRRRRSRQGRQRDALLRREGRGQGQGREDPADGLLRRRGLRRRQRHRVARLTGVRSQRQQVHRRDQVGADREARAIAKDTFSTGFPMVDSYRIQYSYFVDRRHRNTRPPGTKSTTTPASTPPTTRRSRHRTPTRRTPSSARTCARSRW